jgi:hypothetical protein
VGVLPSRGAAITQGHSSEDENLAPFLRHLLDLGKKLRAVVRLNALIRIRYYPLLPNSTHGIFLDRLHKIEKMNSGSVGVSSFKHTMKLSLRRSGTDGSAFISKS